MITVPRAADKNDALSHKGFSLWELRLHMAADTESNHISTDSVT